MLLNSWFSPDLCFAYDRIYFEYELKVLVPETIPYHNCYEIMINIGARRLVLIDIDEDVKNMKDMKDMEDMEDMEDVENVENVKNVENAEDVKKYRRITIVIATKEKIGHETLSESLIEGDCLLRHMADHLKQQQIFLHTKDTIGEITYSNIECAECLFNYCEIFYHLPAISSLRMVPHPEPEKLQSNCISFCGKAYHVQFHGEQLESLPAKPMKFSDFKEGYKNYKHFRARIPGYILNKTKRKFNSTLT
ncbi:unnamed protein product [Albugo candida]|nr:unnamed protein product [Albugo candida]|eukprot:CCI48423.1 unnamed protein product [Albugo candida]